MRGVGTIKRQSHVLATASGGLLLLSGYVLLDWVSFIDPFMRSSITPWNPAIGLAFAFVLALGRRYLPFLLVAPVVSDIVIRHLLLSFPVELIAAVIAGVGYSAVLALLMRPSLRFDPALPSLRDLFLLLISAVAGPAVIAGSVVAMMIHFEVLPSNVFLAASARYWIGDAIGIVVVAPFALVAILRRRDIKVNVETALQLAAVFAALFLIFGQGEKPNYLNFYLLFIPIVWMAVRAGLEGVSAGILITQIALIIIAQQMPRDTFEIIELQTRMIVLAGTGLVAGALVNERRRVEVRLRMHQESLANVQRVGSLGELAAALAHEINQPLMAAGTYARMVANSLRSGEEADLAEPAAKTVVQVERAAQVVRRLRALVKLDHSARAPNSIEKIVNEAIDLCQLELNRGMVRVNFIRTEPVRPVMVDLLQIQQVFINLFRNSIEAMENSSDTRREITVKVSPVGDKVQVKIRDTGPGFNPDIHGDQILPFSSTKADGLGIGLSLSKSIIESHGGGFWVDPYTAGALVTFTLPVAATNAA